jgi:predicted DNA binding CopG/RHH family protein
MNIMIKEPNFDNLTSEEREMEDSFESGEYEPKPITDEQKKELRAIARYTFEKTRTINVRLSERDLIRLKATAAREGVPYQTFLTSLIHKNV